MIRLGLCCIFRAEPIRFRRTTARALDGLAREEQLRRLSELCLANARSLQLALHFCAEQGIGDFRISSSILPLYTQPRVGYKLEELPAARAIQAALRGCAEIARRRGLRMSLHPDQFVLLSSPSEEVTRRSLEELAYQAEVAELVGADVINIHAGGAYGDPQGALSRLHRRVEGLSEAIRRRLTLENDDRIYSPAQLLPLCGRMGLPFVYDVHHHRCLGPRRAARPGDREPLADGLSVQQATEEALASWDREPLLHLSSPADGWQAPKPCFHARLIDPADLPGCWRSLDREVTVEVEAKDKEIAVLALKAALEGEKGGLQVKRDGP